MDEAIYYNRSNDLDPFIGFDRIIEPPIAIQIGILVYI